MKKKGKPEPRRTICVSPWALDTILYLADIDQCDPGKLIEMMVVEDLKQRGFVAEATNN